MKGLPERCRGKWNFILTALGVPAGALNGRHQACPVTHERGNGSPRFRYSNRDGKGNYFCACSTGNEDGFGLLKCMFGWDFKRACEEVERVLPGSSYDRDAQKADDKQKAFRNMQRISGSVRDGQREHVLRYLAGRGITRVPGSVQQARTGYGIGREMDAMCVRIRNAKGEPISMHLTYIEDGKKAAIETPRIVCTPTTATIKGGAARLFPIGADGVLGVAEGVETALAAAQLYRMPVWATISTSGMESFEWPVEVKELYIMADNDAKFGGHKAAYALAHRAATAKVPLKVRVEMPDEVGTDWNDYLLRSGR